jgi:predicted nucleic acid-binding Zn ribbon protein
MTPEICPICGAEVPPNAPACPECGADEQTGWSDRARAQELGLPDDEFDYDEFVKEEFGEKKEAGPHRSGWFWWVIALILLALFVVWMLRL